MDGQTDKQMAYYAGYAAGDRVMICFYWFPAEFRAGVFLAAVKMPYRESFAVTDGGLIFRIGICDTKAFALYALVLPLGTGAGLAPQQTTARPSTYFEHL